MAYIRKREYPSGRAVYVIGFKDQHGRWHERAAGTRRKDAEVLLRRIQEEIAAGTYGVKREDPTFSELLERFLAAKTREVKPRTLEDYRYTLEKYALPAFGNKRISQITPATVDAFLSDLGERGISPAVAGKVYRYVKTVLRYAVRLELLEKDPTLPVQPPRKIRPEMDYLKPEEVRRLLDSTDGQLRAILAVACLAGLRVGEICGLRWRDIDFKAGTIRVVRSYDPKHGFSEPKSRHGKRAVPMSFRLQEILLDHYRERGQPGPEELVFPNSLGKPKDRNALVFREFKRALKEAGLREVRFHDLRHTYAALAIASGMDLKALQAAMGHHSITMTADHYGHLLPGAYDRPLARMDALLEPGQKVIRLCKPVREAGEDAP